ncbi:hypothetical protein BGZ76_008497 [Entomortierella beljakovae]|nr:hypothetical protein BGZ76_008497 [Entomortierella beljakovae]
MSRLNSFTTWAKEHGITSMLTPKETNGMGTGLYIDPDSSTHEETQQGELLFIPNSLLLSRSRILEMHCHALEKSFHILGLDNVSERLAIVLFLLYLGLNSGVGDNTSLSTFDTYVKTLPQISTPSALDPDTTCGYLAGTLLLDSVNAKRSKLESEFELLSGNLNLFESWEIRPNLAHFIWADATFWSRVLSFRTQRGEGSPEKTDDLHMVPFLDFANHDTEPNIRWQVDSDGLRVWAKESLLDRVNKIEKDDQPVQEHEVFLSYGNKSNMELLFLYGFTLKDNPTKYMTIPIPMENETYYMPKAHTLMRFNIPPRITIYLDKDEGPDNLVELCEGIWITHDSQYLLWIYSLNDEDGVGATYEAPEVELCVPLSNQFEKDDKMEEANLVDENTLGSLVLTIHGEGIKSKEQLDEIVPKLEIYPILILRSLVLVASRIEYYIERIMETGDKVQRREGQKLVRHVQVHNTKNEIPFGKNSELSQEAELSTPILTRLGGNTGDCFIPTLLDPDHEHPVTNRQIEIEVQITNLIATMKEYRDEEMNFLVSISNMLGDAQSQCVEKSEFIQNYLSQMQADP